MKIISFISKWKLVFLLLGVSVLIISVLTKWAIVPPVVNLVAWQMMKFSPETLGYDVWQFPPVPVFTKFYVFNVTNPDEVQKGKKPVVEEIGPFAYLEIREKRNIKHHGDEIDYGLNILYTFSESDSCDTCTEDLEVTVPNMALLASLGLLDSLPILDTLGIMKPLFSYINNSISDNNGKYSDSLFNTLSVRELLFDGYTPGVLKLFLDLYDVMKQLLAELKLDFLLPPLPEILADGKFGLWYGRNNTMVNQYYTINTGDKVREKYSQVTKFNGKEKLPANWWSAMGPTPSLHRAGYEGMCLGIHGTDGQQYHPLVSQGEDMWLFTPDLCRSFRLEYFRDVSVNGITTKHFEVPESGFSYNNSDNLCYCHNVAQCAKPEEGEDRWDISDCPLCISGLFNTQGCMGAPAFGSGPHFLYGEDFLVEAIEGLSPEDVKHSTFLNIEPLSGIAFQAHKRIQINFRQFPSPEIDILRDVRETFFPVIWYDEGAEIDRVWTRKYKNMVTVPLIAVDVFTYTGIVIGSISVITAALSYGLTFRNQV